MPRLVTVVSNPNARGALGRRAIAEAARPLEARGWNVTIEETAAPGDASTLAAAGYRDGAEVIVACGGDGTLNEVLNGLARLERDPDRLRPAVAVLPAGTANVWSAEAGIPADPAEALALVDAGARRAFDLGVASLGGERRRFALMCGVGIDAEVTRAVEGAPRAKRLLGRVAFAWPSVRAVATARGVRTAVTSGGNVESVRLLQLVAGNTRLYGGLARITSDAVADDGRLDVVLFLAEGRPLTRPWYLVRNVQSSLRGRLHRGAGEGFVYRRAALLEVRPERAMAVQVDGEPIGVCGPDAPLTLSIEPSAVSMIMPPGENPLFSR